MSLRKRSGEDFEKEVSPEKFIENAKKSHTIMRCGRGHMCSCGKTYDYSISRHDAEVRHRIHLLAVTEIITDRQNGVDRYADE